MEGKRLCRQPSSALCLVGWWIRMLSLRGGMPITAHPEMDGTRAPSGTHGAGESFSTGSAPKRLHPWQGGMEALAFPSLASLVLLIREVGAGRAALPTSRNEERCWSCLMGNRFPASLCRRAQKLAACVPVCMGRGSSTQQLETHG